MIDVFNIPNQKNNIYTFYNIGGNVQTWEKPRNAKLLIITCIGAGGGGGAGGGSLTTTSQIIGGGGGGAGAITTLTIPANLLPDTLYVQVGTGGQGGILQTNGTGSNGSTGGNTFVCLDPNATVNTSQYLINRAAGGGGGQGGSAVNTGGGPGGAGVGTTNNNSIFLSLGLFVGTTGIVGGTGNLTNGSSVTAYTTTMLTSGAGGGGRDSSNTPYSGGSVVSNVPFMPSIRGGIVGNINASSGTYINTPILCGTGGAGGASVVSGAGSSGGAGGNGGIGCGGGGSGASGQALLGLGPGGRGGDGLVIITVVT